MAITNAIENFKMIVNEDFVAKAQALTPALIETDTAPVRTVDIAPNGPDFSAREIEAGFTASRPLGRDDGFCLDFGDHHVGYVSFTLPPGGSPLLMPRATAAR